MTTTTSAALITASTFIYTERNQPGGLTTTAYRIRRQFIKEVEAYMAERLDEKASAQQRRDLLNAMDEAGHAAIRPVNVTPPDLRKMTPEQLLEYANSRARKKREGGNRLRPI
jgi:hypothetical protein